MLSCPDGKSFYCLKHIQEASHICGMHGMSDRQPRANIVDSDETSQNTASDHGLHCFLLILPFLNTSASSKMDLQSVHFVAA